jgi:TRAP-type mannitol/chloroaromatic compound transport system permease small subunit
VVKLIQVIGSINEKIASGARWIMVVLMIVVVHDVMMRYIFNTPTVWAFELAMILGSTGYMLSWGEVERVGMHLRVDVFYSLCSPRWKAIIDVLGTAICWYPVYIAYMMVGSRWAARAWRIKEVMVESYWYPPAAPTRTLIVIGLSLACIQLTVSFIKNVHLLRTGEPL